MINRRNFLSKTAAFSAALVLPRSFSFFDTHVEAANDTVITILHTNDTHSQIDPLPGNDRNAGKGGVARRATLVKKIRRANPNSLLIDAGDVFQGAVFQLFKAKLSKAMSAIGYDVGTLGNHEFDNGMMILPLHSSSQLRHISANYDEGLLEQRVKPYVVRLWRYSCWSIWNGCKSGGLIVRNNFKGITFIDSIAARDVVKLFAKSCSRCCNVASDTTTTRQNSVGDSQVAAR